jgi:hypothetical protein
MHRHLAALGGIIGVAEQLVDVLLDRVAAPEPRALLAVAGKHPVARAQRRGGEVAGLLADRLHVEAEPALALQPHHAIIDDAGQQHHLEHPGQRGVRDAGHARAGQRHAIVVEDATQIVFFTRRHSDHGRFGLRARQGRVKQRTSLVCCCDPRAIALR